MLNYTKKAIFFDLDHTLWDFEKNARETLRELYFDYQFDLIFSTIEVDEFIDTYSHINQQLWEQYHRGEIDKNLLRHRRFRETFSTLGADPNAFPDRFEIDYLAICPRKTHLFPYAIEILEYLKSRYSLNLISNGFREACITKIECSGLKSFFQNIVISEEVGVLKPDPMIFNHTLERAGVQSEQAVMVGDNLITDVKGALDVGIEAIHFDPFEKNTTDSFPQIRCLSELRQFL